LQTEDGHQQRDQCSWVQPVSAGAGHQWERDGRRGGAPAGQGPPDQHQVEDRATRPEWHQSPGLPGQARVDSIISIISVLLFIVIL